MESPKHQPGLITIRSHFPRSRILLRSPITSDAYSFVARVQDPLCTIYLPHLRSPKVPITLASNESQIAAWRAESLIQSLILAVVLLPDTRGVEKDETIEKNSDTATIGETGFGSIDYANKTADCGIMLNSSPEIRGKGYAMETLEMMFAYGFDHLNLETVEFGTHRDNIPMRSLLEKKFEIPAKWREDRNDWVFNATKDWWNSYESYLDSSGEKISVEVEETCV
ncbi:hypothetical protein BYT27DRAFT_7199576 [Phlegmacium glaucopus]|nr:hypothetical protein BYT27DRAFT_7199576 [Phlegmacium glaucopus]